MLTRASADSKKYKSVVELQKNALQDLQKDYNKAIIDLSYNENNSEEKNYPFISELNLQRTVDSNEIDDKHTFSQTVLERMRDRSSPEGCSLNEYYSVQEGRQIINPLKGNQRHHSLYKESSEKPRGRYLNYSNNSEDLEH